MAFAPLPTDETPSNQAFLSSNNNDEEDHFAALDSMVPNSFGGHSYGHYNQGNQGRQQGGQQGQQGQLVPHSLYGQGQSQGQLVPHGFYNTQSSQSSYDASGSGGFSGEFSGGAGGDNYGKIGDGRESGFSGVSESLFDRIRARTAEQQQQQQTKQQQSAFVSQQQQQRPSEPTMELEKEGSIGVNSSNNSNSFNHAGSSNKETTYSFAGPSNFAQNPNNVSNTSTVSSAPRPPTYGPSRNDYVSSDDSNTHPTSIQDKAAHAATQAYEKTSEAMKFLWGKASTVVSTARDGMQGGGDGRGRYSNNFLLRDGHDEEEGRVGGTLGMGAMGGGGSATATMNAPPSTVPTTKTTGAAGTAGAATDPAYSMVAYAKTFCEDLFGFLTQLPPWGKGLLALLLVWAFFAFKG